MVYCYTIVKMPAMTSKAENEEIHWQVIEATLDEFPELRGKAKKYLAVATLQPILRPASERKMRIWPVFSEIYCRKVGLFQGAVWLLLRRCWGGILMPFLPLLSSSLLISSVISL